MVKMSEEIPENCDVLSVKYHCETLSVVKLEELIASNNKPVSAVFPEGTVVIKELSIPEDNQSGYYIVRMSFTTDHPASVWADLVDQNNDRLWKSAIRRSPDNFVIKFHSGDLKKLKVRRFDSGNFNLASEVFEVFWRAG